MKVQYCSDLHLEFSRNADYLSKRPLIPSGDILILAGDITYLNAAYFDKPFFDFVADNYKKVFWVPGNHEFYENSDVSLCEETICENIRDNLFLVNNYSETIDDCKFIFSSMWSHIPKEMEQIVKRSMNDFRLISYNGNRYSVNDFNRIHSLSKKYISEELVKNDSKTTIVVSHHVPTSLCVAPQHKRSPISTGFVADLTELINKSSIDYWIYGHSHTNMDVEIGGCKVVSNQLGYIGMDDCSSFDNSKIISI